MESSQDKNLPATPRRLQKAREDGQVPRAKDLSNLVVVAGGMVLLWLSTAWAYERMSEVVRISYRFNAESLRHPEVMLEVLALAMYTALLYYLPLALAVAVLAALSMVAAGSFAWSFKPLELDLSKIGLISGFGRLFSMQQLFELLKLLAVSVLLALVGWWFVSSHLPAFGSLLLRPLESSIVQLGQWFMLGVGGLLLVLLLVALIDVPLQQYLHRRNLKMSHQEVVEEHKETEGNPWLRAKRMQRQRELAQGSSVAQVPAADLVLMNPTHYAVALKYDEKTMAAPHVIAKGADLNALRIRDMAKLHQVPVLQSPMLARALYAHTEINQQVPAALFTAVAQVLAYVYRLRAALRGQGPMPGQPPKPHVPPELDPHQGHDVAPAQA
ncbi:EscU/YscU/HrcU family type III secretion system export apparatus switch protein [Serpentinimonas maccroryi]|uniref:EscU/YscU/HrcU family type III secretion system export apparatus switch protein n=1 Tax=Serpentinimonas maccroryi TaxID=1458426 RepID=UPI002033F80C|nr:flagellar type III secretion system protein FlhB [Serpentinimonas maccroryi]MCM2478065.1 flagellar biosynthesis protein FlhB [Serpentinimonas maccroryi]